MSTEPDGFYTLQASPGNLIIFSGQSGVANISVLPLGGSTQTVQLSCAALSVDVSCSFSPAAVNLDSLNPGVTKLTINTQRLTAQSSLSRRLWGAATTIAFAGLIFPFGRRRRLRVLFGTMGIFLLALGAVGCGSSSNPNIAPTGTYVLSVSAPTAAGGAAKSVPLVVTIK